MSETEHALLGASSAHRWLHCTPSAKLETTLPEKPSEYAAEGTLAHSLAELKVRKKFTVMKPSEYKKELKKIQSDALYSPEMDSCTDEYLDYITGIAMSYSSKPYVAIEKKVNFSRYAPEGFGTSDCIIIGGNTMHIIDYKHGKGVPVSAEDNPQMMLYALGAIEDYRIIYDIKKVVLTIVQPRLGEISEWETTTEKLLDWGVFEVKPKAQAAYKGEGDFCAGDWCRFCRAKAVCRARAAFSQEPYDQYNGMKPPLITNEEAGDILKRADTIKKWVEDLQEWALDTLLSGNDVPGWKAVEGRSNRQFTDTDQAFGAVKTAGFDEAVLYERKPLTLSALETLLGKKKFGELLTPFITKPPGKPTLAPVTDKREPYNTQTSAAEAFSSTAEASTEKPPTEDQKKFLGLPPYDGPGNIVRGDPYFAKSIGNP